MRLLFVSAQLPGHLDWGGFLDTARALQAGGQEVLWASGKGIEPYLTRANLPAHILAETGWRWPPPPPLPADDDRDPIARQRLRQERALDQWLDVERVLAAVNELRLLTLDYRPHLIVGEMFMAAAALCAEMTGTPFVVAGWPAPVDSAPASTDPLLHAARRRRAALLEACAVDGVNWTTTAAPALKSPYLHLSYWCPTWFGDSAIGPQTAHVGSARPGPPPTHPLPGLPAEDERPVVFITLGTTFNQDPNFFIGAAHAADRLDALPILALGSKPSATMRAALTDRLPRATKIFVRVDFSRTLPFVAAAIHHGGAGTTHALAKYGVPQLIVPHAGDQARQAYGVVRAGAGIHLPARQATLVHLENGLARLLPDLAPLRAGARALQEEMIGLGGPPVAARLLTQLAHKMRADVAKP